MTEEVIEINKRIRNCIVNIVSLYNKESNEFESFHEDVMKYLTNYEIDHKELIQQINTLNIKCNDVKITNDNVHETLTEKNSELTRNQTELNNLEAKFNILREQLEKLEHECIETKKKTELSSTDRTILDLSRKKLELYGQMTNIVWDYSIPVQSMSKNVTGYVKNKENNYIHAFQYKKNEMLQKLWNEIEQGSKEVWVDIIAMTDLKITK